MAKKNKSKAEWQWKDGAAWKPFADADIAMLEKQWQTSGPTAFFTSTAFSFNKVHKTMYALDFGKMTQKNTASGAVREIRRIGDDDTPAKKAKVDDSPAVWESYDEALGKWNAFVAEDSAMLENRWQNEPDSPKAVFVTTEFSFNKAYKTKYKIDFSQMKQINTESGNARKIRRTGGASEPSEASSKTKDDVLWESRDWVTGLWEEYGVDDAKTMEAFWQTKKKQHTTKDLSWNKGYDTPYLIDFTKMIQTNTESGSQRKIRRSVGAGKKHAAASAKVKATGDVVWQMCVNGDPQAASDKWKSLPSKLTDPVDNALRKWLDKEATAERNITLLGSDHKLDLEFLTTTTGEANGEEWDGDPRAAMAAERVLPLRRMKGDILQYPLPGEKHPWDEARIALKEAEGGEDDWLTNEFFFEAFCQAVKEGVGGKKGAKKKDMGVIDFTKDDLFDFRFNQDFRKWPDGKLERRGGVLYKPPKGWKRFAIKAKGDYDDGNDWMRMDGADGEWAVAYHGTPFHIVPKIIKEGFIIGTGQGADSEGSIDSRDKKKVGKGVYCTPNLTVVECYSNGEEGKQPAIKLGGRTIFFAFQCRVRSGAIRRPVRDFAKNNDEEQMGIEGVFEWVINDPKDIRPYGVLVRDAKGTHDHDINQLISTWNTAHKPKPKGFFDKVPGKK